MALEIQTAGTGVVRDAHYVTPTGASTPVRTLLLEPQRTNLCIRSQEFDTWTSVGSNTAVTANSAIAPDGTATADTLTAIGANGRITQTCTFTGDGEKCLSVFLKQGTASVNWLEFNDATAVVLRHRVAVTWTAGVPALSTLNGAGTLYPVQSLGNGWWRLMISSTGTVAANTNSFRIWPDPSGTTGTVLAWGAQAENAVVPSSYIPTEATTVTRNADSLYWDIPALVPRELTVYVRDVNIGARNATTGGGQVLWQVGNGAIGNAETFYAIVNNSTPRIVQTGYRTASTNYTGTVDPGAGEAPVLFDVCEYRSVLTAGFAATAAVSRNGGAESSSTGSAGPASTAFTGTRFYLAGVAGASFHAPLATTNIAIALGTKTRAEMRAIAGVP